MNRAPEAGESKKDTNLKTVEMVRLISQIGPDIPEISRRLHQFKESVRYRYKQKILKRGLAIQAMVDHEKLGLERVSALVKFTEPFEQYAESILTAMSELCYVVGFERTLPEGSFIVNASVPREQSSEFTGFMAALKNEGLFSNIDLYQFDSFRNSPMRGEFYDFDRGLWDFDWSSAFPTRTASSYTPSRRVSFDHIDLLLLKELQVDATRSLARIASKLKINYKKLVWHYSSHVLGRRLVKGYTINWMGTRYESKVEKALHRRHRYIRINLLVRCKDEAERMRLMSKSNSVPFLWAEAFGSDYLAEFAFPTDFTNEAMEYLRLALQGLDGRARYFIMDQTHALAFTISYKLFDDESKEWMFNRVSLLARFGDLLQKIRSGSG